MRIRRKLGLYMAFVFRGSAQIETEATVPHVLTATTRGLLRVYVARPKYFAKAVCRCAEIQSSARRRSFSALKRSPTPRRRAYSGGVAMGHRDRNGYVGPLAVDGMRCVLTDVHAS